MRSSNFNCSTCNLMLHHIPTDYNVTSETSSLTNITISPSQNCVFFRLWLTANTLHRLKREVKPNLSFSIPLGTLNPYSWENDNNSLMEVKRKERRGWQPWLSWRARKSVSPSTHLTKNNTTPLQLSLTYALILVSRTVFFMLEKVFCFPF